MKPFREKGAALIFALILVFVLSVMAVSLMFLSQSETWSSMNYRLMTQARYGAEAGLHQTANYFVYSYSAPGTAPDPITAYDLTKSPVSAGGNPVLLSSIDTSQANYPVSSVKTAFNTASKGSVTAGNVTVNYTTSALLISMKQVPVYPTGTLATVQTWLITAHGDIANIRNAEVEVSTILERAVSPTFSYAAFADDNGCGALSFGGGGTTNSYDSTALVGGVASFQNSDGNVGTNGNLSEVGSTTTINGTLSTPRAGIGTCSSSNVTALTQNGNATVTGGIVELPQPVNNPVPVIPPPGSNDLNLNNKNCSSIPGCSGDKGNYTLAPGSYNGISLSGGATLHLTATGSPPAAAGTPAYYNINTINLAGNSTVVIDPPAVGTQNPVVLNITGGGLSSNQSAIDFSGGNITNASLDPSNFQILYAGTSLVKMVGGSKSAALVYAPNASAKITGGSDFYGSIIAQFVTDFGGAAIHYDRHLKTKYFNVGNFMMSSFTWSKY